MALGIDSGEVFNRVCTDLSFEMETGDCILLYTDGATESLNHQGLEYGVERLIEALQSAAPQGRPKSSITSRMKSETSPAPT